MTAHQLPRSAATSRPVISTLVRLFLIAALALLLLGTNLDRMSSLGGVFGVALAQGHEHSHDHDHDHQEVQLSRRPAEVLAAEANVALYELDPKGGVAGRDTYEQLLLFNAAVLAEALQGP